jgi:hypothetical protein
LHFVISLGIVWGNGNDNLKGSKKMNENENIKVGDTVTYSDNSYAFGCGVTEWGGLLHGVIEAGKLTVIGIGFKVVRNVNHGKPCDLMLKDKDGVIWFAPSFLAKPKCRAINIDGKEIRLSEESFQELKRQLN